MTLEEIDSETRHVLIPMKVIPRIFQTSLSGAYTLAAKGEIETIKLGRRRMATSAPIRAKFGLPPVMSLSAV